LKFRHEVPACQLQQSNVVVQAAPVAAQHPEVPQVPEQQSLLARQELEIREHAHIPPTHDPPQQSVFDEQDVPWILQHLVLTQIEPAQQSWSPP
jgi:hypothetical protein